MRKYFKLRAEEIGRVKYKKGQFFQIHVLNAKMIVFLFMLETFLRVNFHWHVSRPPRSNKQKYCGSNHVAV